MPSLSLSRGDLARTVVRRWLTEEHDELYTQMNECGAPPSEIMGEMPPGASSVSSSLPLALSSRSPLSLPRHEQVWSSARTACPRCPSAWCASSRWVERGVNARARGDGFPSPSCEFPVREWRNVLDGAGCHLETVSKLSQRESTGLIRGDQARAWRPPRRAAAMAPDSESSLVSPTRLTS